MMKLRRMGIGIVLLGVGIGAGSFLLSTRVGPVMAAQGESSKSEPFALLRVDPPHTCPIDAGRNSAENSVSRDLITQIELLRSRTFLTSVVADAELAELPPVKRQHDPASWLAERLMIVNLEGTALLRITMDAPDVTPKDRAHLINNVVQRFIRKGRDEGANALEDYKERLSDELNRRMKQLQESRTMLESASAQIEPALRDRIPAQSLASYALELRRKQLDLAMEKAGTEALLERVEDKAAANLGASDQRARLDERLAIQRAQEDALRAEAERIDKDLGEPCASKAERLEGLRDEIRREVTSIEKLKDQIFKVELVEGAWQHSRIRVIDTATAP